MGPVKRGPPVFLGATKHLYNWLCPLVGWLVGWVTHSFDDPHVAPYWPTWPCYYISLCFFSSLSISFFFIAIVKNKAK